MSMTDDKYNYVDVIGVGFEGCLNLFHGDGIIALVRDLQLASRIRATTPSRESLKQQDDQPATSAYVHDDRLEADAQSAFGWIKSGHKIHSTESITVRLDVDVAIVSVGDVWHGMRKNEDGNWYNFIACNAETYDDAVSEVAASVRSEFNAGNN